jgi:hypothetical protein
MENIAFWESDSYFDVCHRSNVFKKAWRLETLFFQELEKFNSSMEEAKNKLKQTKEDLETANHYVLLSKCSLK